MNSFPLYSTVLYPSPTSVRSEDINTENSYFDPFFIDNYNYELLVIYQSTIVNTPCKEWEHIDAATRNIFSTISSISPLVTLSKLDIWDKQLLD